jgi:hypothetical protein
MLSSVGKRIGHAHSHGRDKDALVESAIDRIGVAMDAALSRRCRGETRNPPNQGRHQAITSSEAAPQSSYRP